MPRQVSGYSDNGISEHLKKLGCPFQRERMVFILSKNSGWLYNPPNLLLLTFRSRNYFFNFSTPVHKMWIIQEPNMLELWNKQHFEEEKTDSIHHLMCGWPCIVIQCGKEKPTRCHFCILSLLIVAQHVSGNYVPIIRSWRLRDVIALCWYVPWLQEDGQVQLVGSASMDGFVVKQTHPWTHYLPTGLYHLPAATAHNSTRL